MKNGANVTVIQCRGLNSIEYDKVTRLDAAIAQRFTARGHAVRICQPAGEGANRLLCFLTADGRNLGSVSSITLIDEPDDTSVGLITTWV